MRMSAVVQNRLASRLGLRLVLPCVLLLCFTEGRTAIAHQPSTGEIRESVQRSIPYIQQKGADWIAKKDCVSCHRIGTMVWSLAEARRRSFKVSEQFAEWRDWAIEKSLSTNDKGKVIGSGNKEGVAQLLLARDSGEADSTQAAVYNELALLLGNDQEPDGSWKPGGQLPSQKRPQSETATVSTAWISLAMLSSEQASQQTETLQRAAAQIEDSPTGTSIEMHVVRLLLAVARADADARSRMIKQLRTLQHDDGSWGWLIDDPGDALGTGMSLYALARAGVDRSDPMITAAQRFLLTSQQENGSWEVKGTKANKQKRVEETAVYWGTTWAALGLMASLPE